MLPYVIGILLRSVVCSNRRRFQASGFAFASAFGLLVTSSHGVGRKAHEGFLKLGVPFWEYLFGGPNSKDCSILGSTLRCPYLGKLPHLQVSGLKAIRV